MAKSSKLTHALRWAMRNEKAAKASTYAAAQDIYHNSPGLWALWRAMRPPILDTRHLGAGREPGLFLAAQEIKQKYGEVSKFFFGPQETRVSSWPKRLD